MVECLYLDQCQLFGRHAFKPTQIDAIFDPVYTGITIFYTIKVNMHDDIAQQPAALRAVIGYYQSSAGAARLAAAPIRRAPILTGMGASYHAALAIIPYFHHLGIPALAVEATDLLYYSQALLQDSRPLIFISQSGASAEVVALAEVLPADTMLMAVTNDTESVLAQRAQLVLPTLAGKESGVATKTYLNCMAVLWLLARRWGGALNGDEGSALEQVAAEIERLVADADATAARWLGALGAAERLVFAGHGPHVSTARQAAMMLAERARVAAIGMGVGALRHGPIEIAQPDLGAVIFASPGRSSDSAIALAGELAGYGAQVLIVEHGRTRSLDEALATAFEIDEFLAPLLDVIPAQIFADALACKLGVGLGFRYIGKVVTRL
jgi:glutamine---fructose-6-phosphate transaminase (isomerizing)